MDYIEKARTITCGALCHYGHRKYSEMWQNKRALANVRVENPEHHLNRR